MHVDVALELEPSSRLASLHGTTRIVERTTCNYGLAPDVQHIVSAAGIRPAAIDDTGEVRAVERPDHPFFVATLYQPQLRSSPASPHPVFTGLLRAAACG